MNAATTTESIWAARVRVTLALLLAWLVIGVVGSGFVFSGFAPPPVFAGAPVFGALILLATLILLTYVIGLTTPQQQPWQPLMIVYAALAIWMFPLGTLDHWLVNINEQVGAPRAAPYWPLLADFLLIIPATLGCIVAGLAATGNLTEFRQYISRMRDARADRSAGLLAMGTTAAVFLVLMAVLTGPPLGQTLKGQVYFAVAVAAGVGAWAAVRVSRVDHPIWLVGGLFVAGLVAVLVAAVFPGLRIPSDYELLNTFPAWGPVRALPLELVSVGVVGVLWSLRQMTIAASASSPH